MKEISHSKTRPLEIPFTKLKENQFIGLHHELFSLSKQATKHIRVCASINYACFWIGVDSQYYQINTQNLMDLIIPEIIRNHKETK